MCALGTVLTRSHLPALLLLSSIAAFLCGGCFAKEDQDTKEVPSLTADAEGAIAELMSATTYSELEQMALRWEQGLPDQSRVKLLRMLRLQVLNLNVEPQHLEHLSGKGLATKHDLSLSVGRAVWAIERIFGIDLFEVQFELTVERLREIDDTVIDFTREWTRDKVKTRLAAMSKSERLEQARSPKPLIYPEETLIILDQLAEDPEPRVRMEVLNNPLLPYNTVMRRIEKEEDPQIKEKLDFFKHRTFSMPRDLPKPEGW